MLFRCWILWSSAGEREASLSPQWLVCREVTPPACPSQPALCALLLDFALLLAASLAHTACLLAQARAAEPFQPAPAHPLSFPALSPFPAGFGPQNPPPVCPCLFGRRQLRSCPL